MGRGATTEADLQEITDIISSTIATTQMNNASVYDSNNTAVQINANTEDCINAINVTQETLYQTNSAIFTDTNVMQSVYANIINELTSTQDAENKGSILAEANADLIASISNCIQSSITAESILSYTNSYVTSVNIVQVCVDSKHSVNYFYGTKTELISELSKMYSSMVTDQGISATVSNYLTADQTAATTGLLAIIVRGIIVICIVIVLIVVIVIAIIVVSYLKM